MVAIAFMFAPSVSSMEAYGTARARAPKHPFPRDDPRCTGAVGLWTFGNRADVRKQAGVDAAIQDPCSKRIQ